MIFDFFYTISINKKIDYLDSHDCFYNFNDNCSIEHFLL